MGGSVSAFVQSASHIHLDSETCPWCEQSIPHDKFEEITARIAQEEQARLDEQEARLLDQFAAERRTTAAKVNADFEALRQSGEVAVAAAHREADAKIAAVAAETEAKLSAAFLRGRLEAETALSERLDAAEARVEQASKERLAAETALRNLEEAHASQTAQAEAAHNAQLTAAVAAAEAGVAEKLKDDLDAAVARAQTAETARAEAERQAGERVTAAEREAGALRQRIAESDAAHATELDERINEVRESLGRENTKSLLAAQAGWFAEKQKLMETAEDFRRQLERKTAAELGEGAEIELFEALRQEFEGDTLRRVPKGDNGADIIHDIVENGVTCGRIVYDSKNRNAWQNNFAVKLRSDMIAATAQHAILSTNKFPAGAGKQLHLHEEGVILACPARVVTLARMLRDHLVQTHNLRLSAEQREEKTAALYDFITSERCHQLMDSLQASFEKLEEIDVDEQKAHQTVWTKRGRIIKDVEKTRGTFVYELNRIIGTAEAAE
ncbi:MAG TPA: DUF2130 domain-containing protein [Devosia sp.]|nr:DUF2130 domain-containing protein [Devosia sp.]